VLVLRGRPRLSAGVGGLGSSSAVLVADGEAAEGPERRPGVEGPLEPVADARWLAASRGGGRRRRSFLLVRLHHISTRLQALGVLFRRAEGTNFL
jgi:hypothetical protein